MLSIVIAMGSVCRSGVAIDMSQSGAQLKIVHLPGKLIERERLSVDAARDGRLLTGTQAEWGFLPTTIPLPMVPHRYVR